VILEQLKTVALEVIQVLESEASARAGGAAARHRGGFDQESRAAAHRIEQRFAVLPAGQHDDARGEVLPQRRTAGAAPQATVEKRFSGRVQVADRARFSEEGVYAHVGTRAVAVGPAAEPLAKAVADRVLDAQGGELEALQRALLRGDVDTQRAFD